MPTSSSWLNLVRFFADLTGDVIRAGSFASVNELVRDIETYLAERNVNPKPYKWKAEGTKILSKIKRARAALDKYTTAIENQDTVKPISGRKSCRPGERDNWLL
jgi:hypothetical protein